MGASYVSDAAVNSDDFEPEKTGGIDKPHLNPNVVNMPTCDHVAVSTLPSAAVKAASAGRHRYIFSPETTSLHFASILGPSGTLLTSTFLPIRISAASVTSVAQESGCSL